MLKAVQEMKWKGGPVPRNAPGCTGRKVCTFGCPEEAKRSTQISYLPEARKAGAQVKLNSPVTKLLLKGKRVIGVEAEQNGIIKQIYSDKVVISCGALETPAFLQRNGIDVPKLGSNLSVHPEGVLAVHFEEDIQPRGQWVPQGVYSDEFLEEEGIMFLQASVPSVASLPGFIISGSLKAFIDYKHTALWGIVVRDEGNRGYVKSGHFSKRQMRYRPGLIECQRMRRGYLHLAEAAFRIGATGVTPFFLGAGHCKTFAEFKKKLPNPLPPRAILPFSLHSMGSCGIGRTCEADGRVRGYENLYVADASLFPTSIGVNLQFTIMALSTMIASKIMGI
ncbi:MAG: GMC family oxidoreductase [Bacteroidetes bacterium]|nr:GMC family oxidoreductase [Bacteroidota bacterium]